ncbi:MAG TPA: TonB-dependent receptor [Terriglobales bacterium]|nr:TonB-dependent receptor [Terriglobales bacterium]
MPKRLLVSAAVCVFLFATLTPQFAFAQAVYGSILGTVTDPQGAAVPNAKVTVIDQAKGTSDTTTTNADGNYSVTHLIPDLYTIRVEVSGFKAAESKDIVVSADTGSRADMQLEVGGTTETVEVTGEAPQLKTDRADVATTFNDRYVEELPLLNRNFTSLELLSPGTQLLAGWNHAATENPQGSQQIFVNGQHFSGTAYELDGTDNQDPILGIIVVNPNVDAITETKINLQNYDAEFGKAVAGVVTVQTKSGTNDYHGELFWFRRTDALQARDPFTQYAPNPITGRSVAPTHWNQFGATFGGPIIKDKLFFFADYQGTRETVGNTFSLTVPTTQVLSSCGGAGDGSGFCKLDQYVPFLGTGKPGDPSTLIYDPATPGATIDPVTGNPVGRKPFCGPAGCATEPNWIPFNRLTSVARTMLSLFPSPSNSGITNNFNASGAGSFYQNQFDTRIDYNASQSLQVFGRYSYGYYRLSGSPALGPALGGVGFGLGGLSGRSNTKNRSLSVGVTKTLSTSLLTDIRFGYMKYNPQTHKPDEGVPAATNLQIPNMNLGGDQTTFTSGLPMFDGLRPAINAGSDQSTNAMGDGLNVGRCNCPLVESEQQFQWVNNWTKTKGNHIIKWGGDIRYAMNLRVPSDANRTGQLHFTSSNDSSGYQSGATSDAGTGGAGFANFLLGEVQHMDRFVSTSLNAAERQKRFFFYGQDTWRATKKLTLNYGMRWETYLPEYVNGKGNGGFANPDEGIIRVAGYGRYGLNGNIDNDWKLFAPRLGAAYELTPKTVVRLGYGRSYDIGVFGSNFGHAVTQNLPVLVNQQVFANNNTDVNGLPSNVNNAYFSAFTLAQGPPLYQAPPIPADGVLPLGGPDNNVQPRMRPVKQRVPLVDSWNATVQRQLTPTISFEASYVGNKGTHVFAGNGPAYDLNQVRLGPGTAPVTGTYADGAAVPAGTSCSATDAVHGAVACSASFKPATPPDQRRPFYNHFSIPYTDPTTGVTRNVVCCIDGIMGNYFGNDASSNYNSLQLRVDKRFSHGLQFMSVYTFSHAKNFTNDNGFLYSANARATYGRDDMNRNHVWINNAFWELPVGKGKTFFGNAGRVTDLIIGGWQITNTTNWSSGLPWTPTAGDCGQLSDTGPCLPNYRGKGFNVGAGSLQHPASGQPYIQFFTPVSSLGDLSGASVGQDACALPRAGLAPFSLPACGTQGDVGRNTFTGPRAFTDDMSIAKNFGVTERFKLQFRMDVFNLFNHPVLDFSSQDGAATGGTCIDCTGNNGTIRDIQYGTTMREIQFALKVFF